MATNTPNFGFIKPSQDDFYDVDEFNTNMDTVDAALFKAQSTGSQAKESAKFFTVSTSAGDVATKTTEPIPEFVLTPGMRVAARFENQNTFANVTNLNFGESGAIPMVPNRITWRDGAVVYFVYDGANWVAIAGDYQTVLASGGDFNMVTATGKYVSLTNGIFGTLLNRPTLPTEPLDPIAATFSLSVHNGGATNNRAFQILRVAHTQNTSERNNASPFIFTRFKFGPGVNDWSEWELQTTQSDLVSYAQPRAKELVGTFNVSGIFEPADYGLKIGDMIDIYMAGAGAGGGAGASANNTVVGAGGGGGGYCFFIRDFEITEESYLIVVGSGGAGGIPIVGIHGADGGSTIAFGITAPGGKGGIGGGNFANVGRGGDGGSGGGSGGGTEGGAAGNGGSNGSDGDTLSGDGGDSGGNIEFQPINPYDLTSYGCGGAGAGGAHASNGNQVAAGGTGGGAGGKGGRGVTGGRDGANGKIGGGGGGGARGGSGAIAGNGGDGGDGGGGGGGGGSSAASTNAAPAGNGGNGGDGIVHIYAVQKVA